MLTDDRLHRRGLTLAGAGMVVLSPDALLIRLIDDADLFQIVFYRTLFMGIVLALGLGAYYGHRLPALMVALGWRGALSSVLMAASNVGFVGAMLNTSVANALVILATIPIFGALFSWLLLGERIRRQTAIAILLAIAGVLVIVSGSLGRGSLLGDAIALGIAVMQGLNLTILRGAGDKDATLAICIAGFLAAAAALPLTGTLRVSAHDLGLLALLETTLGPIWVWVGVGEVPPDEAFIGGALVVGAIVANSVMPSRGDGPISRRPPRGARAGRSRPRERRSRAPRRGT